MRVSLQKDLRRATNPLLLATAKRLAGVLQSGTGLHLDQRQQPATPGDQVDFPDVDPEPSDEDAIALEAKPAGRKRFGPPASVPGAAPSGPGHALPRSRPASAKARA